LTELAHRRKKLSEGIFPTEVKVIAFMLAVGARTSYCCASVMYSEVVSPGQKAYQRKMSFAFGKLEFVIFSKGISRWRISSPTQQRERFLSSLVPNSQNWSESVQLCLSLWIPW